MKRVQGSVGTELVECINRYIGKYRIRWDMKPEINENTDIQIETVSYFETEIILQHKPNINDIKKAILEDANQMIDEKIISGFVWNDMLIWLNTENQFNYKAAFDLAVQSGGASLPVKFKFGDTENPIYYEFKSLEELSDFYMKAIRYISDTLEEGWILKDSINWDDYKKYL